MKSIAGALLCVTLCAGCAPLPITVASLLADGVSYATTEKSLADHGLSALSKQDCAMHRLLTEGVVCRDDDGDIVIASAAIKAIDPAPAPQTVATPAGNVAITHLGSIGDPIPGIYMVLASSRDIMTARTFRAVNKSMAPQVFTMPAGGRRVMYHVIVGPMTKNDYISARKSASSQGFKNTWALKIDEHDWRRARELEHRERMRQSAERINTVR